MKRILITGGPTNEPIDEVMKITNMSTGSLSVALSKLFAENGYEVTAILNNAVYFGEEADYSNLNIVRVETTMDMLNAIKEESKKISDGIDYDAIVHASAVGDYRAEFSFLLEDLAEEIFEQIDNIHSAKDVFDILQNPNCKVDDSSKISSYQKNLTVKLGLTPKIISSLRDWFPNTLLIGCKLLENVSKEELYSVAQKLAVKNNMDYILANDLADLRKANMTRHLVNKDGFTGIELKGHKEIFKFINEKIK